jgi:hypothetical protein
MPTPRTPGAHAAAQAAAQKGSTTCCGGQRTPTCRPCKHEIVKQRGAEGRHGGSYVAPAVCGRPCRQEGPPHAQFGMPDVEGWHHKAQQQQAAAGEGGPGRRVSQLMR